MTYEPEGAAQYKNVSPLLFLGVFVFVVPYLGGIMNLNIPGWVSGIGVVIIILGAIHSMLISG